MMMMMSFHWFTSTVFLPLLLVFIFGGGSSKLSVQAAKIVSIGDSFTTGTGTSRSMFGYDEWLGGKTELDGSKYSFTAAKPASCWRDTNGSPGAKLAADMGMEFVMGACWGADIEHLYDQVDYLNAKYPDEAATQWEGSTFHLTLGLNNLRSVSDQRWGEILLRCVFGVFGECTKNPENNIGNQETMATELTAALSHLTAFASKAKIRVLGYGRLFQRHGGDCGAFGISNGEADFLDHQWFDEMNDISAAAVAELKLLDLDLDIEFIDVNSYLTVGSCVKEGRHLNGFFDIPLGSYHPSQLGYDQYYRALKDNLSAGN